MIRVGPVLFAVYVYIYLFLLCFCHREFDRVITDELRLLRAHSWSWRTSTRPTLTSSAGAGLLPR